MTTTKTHAWLRVMTVVVGIAVILSMTYLYALLYPAQGAALSSVSDVLSTSGTLGPSAPSVAASHTITFTLASTTTVSYDGVGADTVTVYFDDTTVGGNNSGTEAFDFPVGLVLADIDFAVGPDGGALVDYTMASDTCGTGTEDLNVTINDIAEDIVFEICSEGGSTPVIDASDIVEIQIGSVAGGSDRITNPSTASASYPITIEFDEDGGGGAIEDEGEARVMILDQVVMTAEVETNLTCYVAGLADGAGTNGNVNGRILISNSGGGVDGTATAVLIDFGVVTPNDAATGEAPADQEALGQQLEVATNAINGFLWTVEADQVLTSATGADIDEFLNDAATSTPTDWNNPTGTIAATESGWGHLGLTSEDDNLQVDTANNPADDFTDTGNALCETATDEGCWVGNYLSARNVFAHTGPADGDGAGNGTADMGLTEIAWGIEISSLQEAAVDYTNTWTHICTPTF